MIDRFDEIIEKFLAPLDEVEFPIRDSIYFLRKDGCFVFSHGYYHPTPGHFIGKIIYYPTADGESDIWGRRYQAMHKTWIDGRHRAIPNDAQIERHYQIDPSLVRSRPRPLVADYTIEFPLADFVGWFPPRKSLRLTMEMYPQIKKWALATAELVNFPLEKMGVTGSLAYGKIEEQDMDFDVLFRGTLEESRGVLSRLYRLAREPERKVFEFGKLWPMRIFHQDYLLCPFFVYEKPAEAPLCEAEIELVEPEVEGTAVIADDTHNAFLPIFLGLDRVEIAGRERPGLALVCYDGSIRGEYRRGERIRFKGRLLKIRTPARGEFEAVAVDISFDLDKIEEIGE